MNIVLDVCFLLTVSRTSRQFLAQYISQSQSKRKANCVEISKTYRHSNSTMNFGLIVLPNKLSLFFEPSHHLSCIINIWTIRHCHQWHLLPFPFVKILTSSMVSKHSYLSVFSI